MDKSRFREDTDDSDESLDVSKQRPSVQTPLPAVPAATPSRTGSRASAGSWRPGLLDLMSGGVECPTCRGTGRLPRGQNEQLVALIPYSDKRLKPRRRWCVYVSIVLVVLLVCGGVLLAFMFPRAASISLLAMNSSTEWSPLHNASGVSILMETRVRIKNNNFFRLEVQWLNISLFNSQTQVGDKQTGPFSIGPRQDSTTTVEQNATFTDDLASKVRSLCTGGDWQHCLSMFAMGEMKYTVLSHTAEIVTSKHSFFVACDVIQTTTKSTPACS
ncbi:Transmembrane protein 106A [Geodia barretti]|uniref:Transmembrane protein 106A n=1 Tax=Geodia barretti TaxID=519541 RepID=A0AA35R9H1_GEOBA|nr:Transmembrane protein 106A [Geodia barretti]